jgi:hypothetical protein
MRPGEASVITRTVRANAHSRQRTPLRVPLDGEHALAASWTNAYLDEKLSAGVAVTLEVVDLHLMAGRFAKKRRPSREKSPTKPRV